MRVCFKVENNVTSEHKRYLGHMFSGVHFNDSHNTQPSENYLNLLIARIFAIEFFIATRDYSSDFEYFSLFLGIQQNSVLFICMCIIIFSAFGGDLPNVICLLSRHCQHTNNVVPQHMK